MASNSPYFKPQDPEEVTSVINKLDAATIKGAAAKKQSYSCKKSTFPVNGSKLNVQSWKFNDWDFKKFDLPTHARGLFTYQGPSDNHYEIVTRGYDKFFNIDEVHQTKWSWIEENTKGPYEVTVKENGCIIFISGLPDGTLLVCSKHSTGAREDINLSHAVAGEKWVDKHLQQVGKTRADLAKALHDANATAVAELCDDNFEEHVLAYEGDSAGLYLHGINLNLPTFATYPSDEVRKFADTWGFKMVDYFEKQDVKSLRQFLEEAAETGSWDGKDVEGFVIRCKARHGPNDPLWHDWFFKYKFEEPYLMYRQWRECTKAMINAKPPKAKKHQAITKEYLAFAANYFREHPGSSVKYQANHGIIRIRNAFLDSRGLKGSDIIRQEAAADNESNEDITKDLVLVPIATIGCGKTTVAFALTKLFGWGHVQNDNIQGRKGRGAMFASAITMELMNKPVVIADRNNHQKRERLQIFEDVSRVTPDARYVALHYVHEKPDVPTKQLQQQIRKATRDRVFARGDNHQTIQAASLSRVEIEGIMDGFINRFEPLDIDSSPDRNFDSHINLDPEADSRTNLETVVTNLKVLYPKLFEELPTAEEYDEAIDAALKEYTVDIKHSVGRAPSKTQQQKRAQGRDQNARPTAQPSGSGSQKLNKAVEYFSITLPTSEIISTLDKAFSNAPANTAAFYNTLKSTNRIQNAFHITLIHQANSKTYPALWSSYQKKLESSKDDTLGPAQVELEKIVWDGRIMAITAKILDEGLQGTNRVKHITIGTKDSKIKPKEANEMLEKWMGDAPIGNRPKATDIPVGETVLLEGIVKAVAAR